MKFMDINGKSRAQVTINNLVSLFITLILYLICFVPVITPIINSTVLYLNTGGSCLGASTCSNYTTQASCPGSCTWAANLNSLTPLIITLLYITPFFFLLAIIMTALNWAMPRQESQYR